MSCYSDIHHTNSQQNISVVPGGIHCILLALHASIPETLRSHFLSDGTNSEFRLYLLVHVRLQLQLEKTMGSLAVGLLMSFHFFPIRSKYSRCTVKCVGGTHPWRKPLANEKPLIAPFPNFILWKGISYQIFIPLSFRVCASLFRDSHNSVKGTLS
jgi:hypothetical protein